MLTSKKKNKNTGSNGLDEKGHPLPSKNPDGGTPICPSGSKIDNGFDVTDPLNPPFRCIPDMMSQEQISKKIMNNLNHPSNNITRVVTLPPAAGGGSSRTRTRRRTRMRRRTHVKHRHRRPSSRTRHRHRHT